MSLGAALSYGLVPGVGMGVVLGGDLPIDGRFRLGLRALLLPATRVELLGTAVEVGLTAGIVTLCYELMRGRLAALGGCAGVGVGAIAPAVLQGEARGAGQQLWAAVSLQPRLRVQLVGPLAAELGVDALVPLVRHVFYVGGPVGPATAFQQSPVTVVATFGLAMHFR